MVTPISQSAMRTILERAQTHVLNLLKGQEECLSLLSLAHLIIIETYEEDFPYRLGGTCFLIRYCDMYFIVSTLHGCRNLNYSPEDILYVPNATSKFAFSYDSVVKGKYEYETDKKEDFVMLRIYDTAENRNALSQLSCKNIGLQKDVCLIRDVKDLFTRGYLYEWDSNAIDYDNKKILMRAYSTNGIETIATSQWEGCYWVKFINPKPDFICGHPNGMSGAPVFGLKNDGTTGLFGMIIEHDLISDKFLILGVEVLNSALRQDYEPS